MAIVELWRECGAGKMTMAAFAESLGSRRRMIASIFRKLREIESEDSRPGHSSLATARGKERMPGTR